MTSSRSSTAHTLTVEQIAGWRDRIRQTTFANYHFEMGLALRDAGDVQNALASLARAAEIQPDLVAARLAACHLSNRVPVVGGDVDAQFWAQGYLELISRYEGLQKYDGAEEWLNYALRVLPGNAALLISQGVLLALRRRHREAHALLSQVEAVAGSIGSEVAATMVTQLGTGLKAVLGDRESPMQDNVSVVHQAIAAARTLVMDLGELAELNVQALMWLERYGEALAAIADLPEDRRRNRTMELLAGTAHQALGNLVEAASIFTACAEDNPVWGPPQAALALVVLAQGDAARALTLAEAARQRDPKDSFTLSCYGMALQAANRVQEAVEVQRSAVNLSLNDLWAQVNLGLALDAIGDVKGALGAYQEAWKKDPWRCMIHIVRRPFGIARLREVFDSMGAADLKASF